MKRKTIKPEPVRNTSSNPKEEPELSRRTFLGRCATFLPGITIVGVLAPLANSCDTTLQPRPSSGNNVSGGTATFDVSRLSADGQGMLTQTKGSDGYAIMIIRIAPGEYRALSTRCSHEACDVNTPENGLIFCACHGSRFSLTGTVLTGPATRNLKAYDLTYNTTANTVTVTLS